VPKLPILSGKSVVKIFERMGYVVVRQRGSHIRLLRDGKRFATIPNYPAIGPGLLRTILREANISPEEFMNLL